MKIGIPRETFAGEKRVATTPAVAEQLQKLGYEVLVETEAGSAASYADAAYEAAGCEIEPDAKTVFEAADIVLKVRAPDAGEQALLRENQTLVSFIWPAQNKDLLAALAERKINVLAMDSVPRISRAQKMDALSSMANIGGYRAVVEASQHFGRFFYRADYRCRQDPTGQSVGDRRGRGGPCRYRCGTQYGRDCPGIRYTTRG